ncbi:aminopeptidase P N-terminal domain-containing protein [Lacinutrix sp. MedPE-SW]|uniref:aminopeptidase P N-terminal domain-containing protein n=1 Tax=Lacinutrix sp. MedPE-SW TaxID=1860087 RepID=UPI000914DBA5|nr:aminopeptidase P N-terminal domain-containing protein [Lacinutrix sp. MedPE-SW]OIQ23937.1 MAG: Xaa-Pro aminopeptidase [Lacinutrix sp. MedPE-SW]
MKTKRLLFFILLAVNIIFAQDGNPTDYLKPEFHKGRRDALRAKMPKNSVAVFFANPVRNRANDVDYIYHQDPDFYYLTGYKEPHTALIVFSQNQTDSDGKQVNEILFVQEKNKQAEMWTGSRLGVEGAKQKLGFKNVLTSKDFLDLDIDYSKFDKVFFHNFNDDYRDSSRNKADLYNLINTFKTQVNFEKDKESPMVKQIKTIIKATEIENSANVAQRIGEVITQFPEVKEDEEIMQYVEAESNSIRDEIKKQLIKIDAKPEEKNYDTRSLSTYMAELREIKTAEELVLLTKAIRISAQGQIEVMKAMHPGMSETEIQGVHEFVYKKYGSEYEGYPSIVGAGNNGCVLHYIENTKMKVEDDLVLMDLGAEYHGYTADVTRTIPANGTFSKEQRAIYDIVLEAQNAGIEKCQVGEVFWASNQAAQQVINKGLARLGIIENENVKHNYLPHGTSHHIGLDVHDPGTYGPLAANQVITVEPGIYIPEGSDCDPKWWRIAVRIEDDILITEKGPVNLSAEAPRKADEIEKLMKKKSALDDFKLPKLD